MKTPRYRLVAIDLDGTLLDSRRRIPEANLLALRRAAASGVSIAIVSGRRFSSLRPYIDGLGVDAFVVANSGAIILPWLRGREGPILRRRLLELETALVVLELALEAGEEPVIHDGPNGEGRIVLRHSAQVLPAMARYLHNTSPAPVWVEHLSLSNMPVQVGFAGGVSAMRSLEETLSRELARRGARASLVRTEYLEEDLALLDVVAPDATKSSALEFLAAHLGIDLESTMAIGDNWNDRGMLERAGLGVIMANADRGLRSLGFAETSTNDEAGVAFAIECYLFEKLERLKKKGGEGHPRSRYP